MKRKSYYNIPIIFRAENNKLYDPRICVLSDLSYVKENERITKIKTKIKNYLIDRYYNKIEKNIIQEVIKNDKELNEYKESVEIDLNDIKNDILLNAIFIASIIIWCVYLRHYHIDLFNLRREPEIFANKFALLSDLFLLDNQIPLQIIKNAMHIILLKEIDNNNADILDVGNVLKKFLKISYPPFEVYSINNINNEIHLLAYLYNSIVPQRICTNVITRPISIGNASLLIKCGIKFNNLIENTFNFNKDTKTLSIPTIYIYEKTEIMLKNLLIYELCEFKSGPIFQCTYLFSCLIKTEADLDILKKHKIIIDKTNNHSETLFLWKNINKHIPVRIFYETNNIFFEINKICSDNKNILFIEFIETYFSKPWIVMSTLAALILLTSTILQTIFTIFAYYK